MTDRSTLRREPQRGSHDRFVIEAIVDEATICHLGFVDVAGHPVVIPTIHARVGDTLYVHGSAASRMMRRLASDVEVCCTITIVDGLVVARSGFWSSMNYRSVMVFGASRLVVDAHEKALALDAIVDHVLPGRSVEIRRPTTRELAATKVIAVSLDEASAKMRVGDPLDDPDDLTGPAWAGVLPLRLRADAPQTASNVGDQRDVPPSVRRAADR